MARVLIGLLSLQTAVAYDAFATRVQTDAREAVHDPVSSVTGLVQRVLGTPYVSAFNFSVIPADSQTGLDVFEIASDGAHVVIRGNSGVSLSSGLGWYLKTHLNASWTWGRSGTGWQLRTVPPPHALPLPTSSTRTVATVKYRYAYNVCTVGYTMAWWNASQWLEELDRLALWGVNLPLAFVGQEAVWLRLYTQIANLTSDSIMADFFAGPAFAPWQRMGNLQRWGAPMTAGFVEAQRQLGHVIIARMREFGMTPVLPGFAGHVPDALQVAYPTHTYVKSADWNGFNASYSADLLLQPTDPLFATLGSAFYELLVQEFGPDPGGRMFFNADTFNEMDPSSSDPSYLKATNAAIYSAMVSAGFTNATFVMQGWLFVNSPDFWTPSNVQAFLSGVPDDRMLILDLFTESTPTWSRFESYYGKPWVWNLLQVFGGRRATYGNLPSIAAGTVLNRTAPGSTMSGIGITPEATEITPVTFELLWEMAWRTEVPELETWLDAYVVRRYGVYPASPALLQAWGALLPGVYSSWYDYGITTSFCAMEAAPQLTPAAPSSAINPDAVVAALRLFLQAAGSDSRYDPVANPQFRYDLIDLARQGGCDVFYDLATLRGAEYERYTNGGEPTGPQFAATSGALAALIAAQDAMLATDVNYVGLGIWIQEATRWATPDNATEAAWLEFNARNQLTLWGPNGEINDYAAKNGYAGLVGDYYGSRWAQHTAFLAAAQARGQQPDWNAYLAALLSYEQGWGHNTTSPYPTEPTGDALPAALAVAAFLTGDASSYTAVPDTGVTAAGAVLATAWHRDPSVLMAVCSADPGCAGATSTGVLLRNVSVTVPAQGVTLYVRTR